MFGRLQPTFSIQPIDHGSSRNIDDSTVTPTPSANLTSPPPSPFRSSSLAQPTGALHPATLTPISTALPSRSARTPYPQPSNGHRHILPKPVLPTGGTITRPPTARLSNSAGLQGLADAAMMKEAQTGESLADRRLPPPRSSRPAYASHGRFWDDQLSQSRGRPIPPTTATPRPPSHQPRSTHAHSPTPSSPNPSRVPSPTRPIPPPSSATPKPSIAIPLLPKLPVGPKPKLPVGPKPFARPKFKTPHPLADIDLDREYNPPTVDEWEQRALKVLTLPPIPASWYPPAQQAAMAAAALQRNSVPSPSAPGTTRSTSSEGCRPPNPTPPTTAISPKSNFPLAPAPIPFDSPIANPPSPASPISAISNPNSATGKAPRAKRGGDRRPRATPHSSVWAEAVTQLAPHDETGRRIHPPPDGSIPPPPNSSSRSDREMSEKSAGDVPTRKSTSDPGNLADQSRSLAFEAHSTHRRASLRVQCQPGRDSDSVASSRSSRSDDGRDSGPGQMEAQESQGTLVGSQEAETAGMRDAGMGSSGGGSGFGRKGGSSMETVARSEYDAVVQLNVQLQLQGGTDRAGYRDSLAEKDQRIKELETALATATGLKCPTT